MSLWAYVAYNVYRHRVADGQGGWTIGPEIDAVVFGQFHYQMPDTEFICGAHEDLRLDDVIDIDDRYYIVREKLSPGNAPEVKHRIELTDRPQVALPTTTIAATTTVAGTTTVAP